jgi:hypothetical protein
VPRDPPIELFWSVTVYDIDTRATDPERSEGRRSLVAHGPPQEPGWSVDIYVGPKPPAGFEKNWIPTVPGKNWFAYFRFYNPTAAYFDRSWPLSDFEEM